MWSGKLDCARTVLLLENVRESSKRSGRTVGSMLWFHLNPTTTLLWPVPRQGDSKPSTSTHPIEFVNAKCSRICPTEAMTSWAPNKSHTPREESRSRTSLCNGLVQITNHKTKGEKATSPRARKFVWICTTLSRMLKTQGCFMQGQLRG